MYPRSGYFLVIIMERVLIILFTTLESLINGETIINGEGGKFLKLNKRGDPNKRGGTFFFQNLINGEDDFEKSTRRS